MFNGDEEVISKVFRANNGVIKNRKFCLMLIFAKIENNTTNWPH